MAGRNVSEMLAGAAVLVVAVGFLGYAIASTGRTSTSGYTLNASFERIDGLGPGSDVRIAGVKVGRINSATIDPKITSIVMPPMACTTLPTDNPIVDATTISVRIAAAESVTNHVLLVIHSALGPSA